TRPGPRLPVSQLSQWQKGGAWHTLVAAFFLFTRDFQVAVSTPATCQLTRFHGRKKQSGRNASRPRGPRSGYALLSLTERGRSHASSATCAALFRVSQYISFEKSCRIRCGEIFGDITGIKFATF